MKPYSLILLTLLIALHARCQSPGESDSTLRLCPPGLQFPPLKASNQEARLGIFAFLGSSNMAVDIGEAAEILQLGLPRSRMTFALGMEFFGKAFVTGSQGLRLQIDAMDGFFGGHLSWSARTDRGLLLGRLRILHQSAHFVDGHYTNGTAARAAIPFTRDFGELTLGENLLTPSRSARYYAGFSYATLVRPAEVERLAYFAGIEIAFSKLLGGVFDGASNLYIAYQVSLNGTPVYAGSNEVKAGIKFGEWSGRGVDFYLALYDGRQFFGEYFNERVSTVAAGFMADLF
jgi:hypothetical protein